VRVVDEAEQRPVARGQRDQAQGRRVHRESISDPSPGRRQRISHGRTLLSRQPLDERGNRPHQLVKPGVRHLRLGVDPDRAQHPHPSGSRLRVVDERGLADPRVAADHHRAAPPEPGHVKQLIEPSAFVAAAEKHD
jgi:hypothetical protein